jgi:hypothetical protein
MEGGILPADLPRGRHARRPGSASRRQARRPVLVVLAASLIALAGILAPAAAPIARAASDGLQLTTAATYAISPARHVVAVAIDITARNNKPNVSTGGLVTKYFYEGARVAIQSEATNVRATSGGVKLTTTTTPADGYRLLEVRFRTSLFFHQTAAVHVTFDLPGGAPRSKSDIRVGTAFATFVAWAFGDSGSVRVVVPAGFDAEATGSDAARSSSAGKTIFQAAAITDVASWYLVVNADRKSALTSDRIDLSGGEHLVIRAWPEDTKWQKQVRDLLTRGLPELVEQTGLDWPVTGDLSIFEVHTPLLEGYAGVFFQGQDRIEISEDLDDLTIIHEASHAWFNSDLFEGRWINEGLADTYAAATLDGIGKGGWAPNRVSPTDKASVRLVDWVHPGRITDETTDAREQFGYDASWTVMSSLLAEIGGPKMRLVLAAAQDHRIAYAGIGEPETVSGPNDWRRLLDLLDEVGGSRTADDVFRRWIVNDALAEDLDARAEARTAYATLVHAGGDWRPPFYVRGALSDWDFATATSRTDEATALLGQRDAIAAIAGPLGVTLPPDLRTAYEGARDSLADANRVADTELAAARALATASTAVSEPRAPLMTLGLLGTAPEAGLAAARSAFSAGAADAGAQAAAVTALIDGAVSIGRARLLAGIAILVVLVVLLVIAIVLFVRRRRRRAALALAMAGSGAERSSDMAHEVAVAATVAAPAAADAEPPYATLADQSIGPDDVAPIEPEPAPAAPVEDAPERPKKRTPTTKGSTKPRSTKPKATKPTSTKPKSTEPKATKPRSTRPKPPPPNDADEPPPDRGDAS